ncbi:MAG: M28 family metallopeptidase [Phycisphaeraceae bacterium]|nr:M28 family metallopeptidase [Phycisphaerae bacterium]MBX3393135.1 M28 family metallopeptidase [Phycisphaeraceae bacterium]HRJ49474.1 M28 family metallopeptidase [Phycisphaerales bacterium]
MIPLAAILSLMAATPPRHASENAALAMAAISAERCAADVETLAAFGTRHTLSDTDSPTRGIGAARRWIKSQFEAIAATSNGRMTASFETFEIPPGPRVPAGATIVNVVAVLRGVMPEAAGRACYVVGHYDSRNGEPLDASGDAPGANDNASGTAVVLECARVLALLPTDATIVFLATAGEEQGLLGARAHAEVVAAERRWTINGVLNNDIVGDPYGWSTAPDPADRSSIRVFSEGLPRNPSAQRLSELRAIGAENDSTSRQLARFVAEIAAVEKTGIRPRITYRHDRFLRGGDHSCFNDAGFSAVRFTAPKEDYNRQHQDVRVETAPDGSTITFGDLPRFVNPEYLADVARLNAAVLVHLANAPSAPADVRVITAQLENPTTLRWSPSPEPDVAGYEIVWRETTSPTWDHARDVGTTTEAVVELSKDDWFFGVRAYDRDGYRSPVSFAGAATR